MFNTLSSIYMMHSTCRIHGVYVGMCKICAHPCRTDGLKLRHQVFNRDIEPWCTHTHTHIYKDPSVISLSKYSQCDTACLSQI